MMRKIYVVGLMNTLFISLHAQNFDWAKREGLWAYDYGYGIVTDPAGSVYVAGKYEENANFDNVILPCEGNHDIYLAKFSPTGTLNWVTTAGGSLGDYAEGVDCDGNFVYVAGEIEGVQNTIYFQNSNITLTTRALNDAFVAKYDVNGTLLWARSAGWYQNDKALGVTYDNSGNVYICGFFNDTASFGNTMITGYGRNDIFLAKYDASGNFLWVRKAGSTGRDEAKSVKCDAAGNVYICGLLSGTCNFGTQTVTSPNGYYDTFLAKYSPSGTLQWVKTAGSNFDEVGWSLAIDNAGRIYVAGEFNAYAMFGNYPLVTSGNADVFVVCYDASGNVVWVTGAGGPLIDRARGLGCDGTNLYITGQFGSTASFGPYTLTAADSSDIFMACLNNNGNFMWAKSVGGAPDSTEMLGYESGNAICAGPGGAVYATGSLLDNGTFGNITLSTYNRTDVFITRISQTGVGIPGIEQPEDLSLYPNPCNGSFVLDLNGLNNDHIRVTVYNLLGEIVAEKNAMPHTKINMDLAEESTGLYLVEVWDGETMYRKKVILR